jgi:hypothetical protein
MIQKISAQMQQFLSFICKANFIENDQNNSGSIKNICFKTVLYFKDSVR